MSLVKDWAPCVMTRVGNTCPGSLRHSALTMAFRGSTQCETGLNRMVLQKERTGQWRKVSFQCCMNLGCLPHSGAKPCLHSSTSATDSPLLRFREPLLMKHSLGQSLISPTCVFGAVQPMS